MAENNNGKYTNWKKEFGKSVKFAAKDVLTDLAPATVGSARNIAADIRELRQTLRKMAQNQGSINGMVGQQTSEETKLINDAVKNLKDSLETGKFYSEERAKAADPFSNFDANFNFDESSSFTNPIDAVAASIGSQTSRGVKQINSSLEKSTETLAQGFSVLNKSEKHSFILNAALQKRFHSESLEQFKAMNENLSNLVRFNNETNATFVTASMKFYDDSLEELRAIRKGIEVISTQKEIEHDQYTSSEAANVFDERGRFSLKNYYNYVKKNFSSGAAGGGFGMAKMLLNPMFAGEYAANPAHHLLKLGISSMLPKRLTRRITNFDKDMGEYLPALLTGLGEGDGMLSSLLKKFALKNKAGRNNYSPNEFNRGPMAFNGEANKAITEIIPDFLSRILFSIDSMRISVQKNIIKGQMRGMASDSAEYKELQNQITNLGEAQQIRFDWSTDFVTGGRYVTQDVLEKRIKDQRRKAALSGLRDTREEIERASTMLYGRGTDQDTNIRERIDDVLEAIVKGQIDFFGKPNEERLNLVKKYAYNNKDNYPRDEAIEVLGFMNGLSRRAKMNIKGMGTIRGREALNEYWHEYNQAPGSTVDMRNAHNENNGIYNVSTEGSVEYYANNEWLGIYRKPNSTKWEISDENLERFNKLYDSKCKNAEDCIKVIKEKDKKRGTGMMSNIPAEITDPNMRVNYMQYMMAKREKEYRYGIEDDTGSGSFFGKIKSLFDTPINFLDSALNKIDDTIYSLTFGKNGIVSEFKNGLTGKVDEKSGKYEGGLFSEVFNGMKAVGDEAAKSIKEWLPQQVKGLGSIVRQYFFGEDEVDKDGKPVEKEPIMSRLAAKVQLQFSAWSSALFGGSTDDKTGEDGKPLTKQEIIKKAADSFKKAIPTIGKGIAAGAGLGVVAGLGGFGVLGSLFLPGGPIGGAIVGGALGLLSRSKAFMDTMFGEETTDENGNKSRKGGIIPKGFMDWFKKFKIPLIGGAAVGTLSHMLGHGIAFGMMPTIAITAFGPVLAGAAWGLASHSEAFREAIFGKESLNEDGTKKRIGGLLNNAIMRKIKNVIPKGIAGGLTGVAGMGVLSQMGIVGSALALGPIPAAIGGAALGIASASKNFTRAFFGWTDKKGGYHSGALDKIKNYFTWEIFKPIKLFIEKDAFNMKNWFKKNVAYPLADALVPMKIMMKKMGDRILDNVLKIFQPVEKGIRVTFKTIGEKLQKIFNPVLNALSRIAKVTYNATKKLTQASILAAMAPIRLLGGLASGMIKWDAYKKGVGTSFNTLTTNLASGDIRGTLGSGLDFAKHLLRPRIDYEEDKYAKELVEYQDYAKERDAKLKAEMARGETYFASQEKQFLAEREAVRTNKYNLTEEQVKAKMADIEKRKKESKKLDVIVNGTDPWAVVQKAKLDLQTQIKEGIFQIVENTGKTLELDERNRDDNAQKTAEDKRLREEQQQLNDNIRETNLNTGAMANMMAGNQKAAEAAKKEDKGFFSKLFGSGNTFSGGILDGIKSIGSGIFGLVSSAGTIAFTIGAIATLIAKFFDKDNKPGGPTDKMGKSHGAAIVTEDIAKFGAKHLGVLGSIGRGIGRFGSSTVGFIKNIPKNIKGALDPKFINSWKMGANGNWQITTRAKGGVVEAAKSKIRGGLNAVGNLVDKPVVVAKEVASSVSTTFSNKLNAALETVKNSEVAKKLFPSKKLIDFFKAIKDLASKFTNPKTYSIVMDVLKHSKGGLGKLGRLAGKIGTRLGADTVTGGIAIAAFAAYDGYTGWTEAYRMFDVNPQDVDTKMKLINTFVNILFGNVPQLMFLDFGLAMCSMGMIGLSDTYFGQLLSKFGFNIANADHRKVICQFLYKFLATDEELNNLNEKQKDLIKEYDAYINDHQDKKGMTLEEYQAEKGNLTMWEKYGAPVINRILGVTDSEGKPLPSVSEMISDQITGITSWFKKSVDYIMKLSPIGFIKETFGIPSLSELTDRVGNMISEAGSKAFGFFRGNSSYSDDEETSLNDEDEAILTKYKKHTFGGKGHSFNINGEASNKRKYYFAGGFGLGPTVPDFKIMEGDSGMPYYSQMDSRWSKTPLVAGDVKGKTIGEAGCAPTSMAMIVSRLSQTNFDPEDAAKYLDKTDLDSDGFVTPGYFAGAASAANLHGHVLQETDNQEFKNLLEKGNMMILGGKSMKPSSPFFGSGHYVVAAGLSPRNSNYALVYDPISSGKSKEYPISDLLDQSIRNEGWGAYFDYSPYNQPGTISQKTLDAADVNEDKIVIDLSDVKGTGEGQFWVKQHPGVSIDGCVKDTIATLNVLGKYFLKKYGKRLVLTAGTNGSHAGGEHSHANGWKLDVNDWGGPDGLQGQFISKNAENLADFIAFGNAIGVGMNPECWGTDSEHIDVCVDGTQWHDPNAGKNFGGFGKGSMVKNVKGLGRIRTHGKKGNGKPRRKYEKSVTGLLSFFKDSVSTAIDATIAGKKWNPLDFNQMEDFASDGISIQNDGRTAALNEDTKENQINIWKYLTGDLHMNREGAAGVMGNLMRESGFRTSAMGDNNTSMGIAQWHNERMTSMKNYAASVGKAPTDLDAQLGYLKQELTTGYKDVYDSVKSAPSVEYSVDKWVRGFERPANMDQEVLERLPYANTVFKDRETFAGGLRGFNSHEAKEVLSKATKLKPAKFAGGAYGLNTFDEFAKRNGVSYEGIINQFNSPYVAARKAEVVKAAIKKDSDLSGGSMGELLNSVRALDTHNDLSQMISLLKVIAEKEAVTINNNQTFSTPRSVDTIDERRVVQAMNRIAQNRNQARLGDERLKRLMDLGSNVGDLAMDQYQMAYKISQGGNFKTV